MLTQTPALKYSVIHGISSFQSSQRRVTIRRRWQSCHRDLWPADIVASPSVPRALAL
jgi:hypothetical protein